MKTDDAEALNRSFEFVDAVGNGRADVAYSYLSEDLRSRISGARFARLIAEGGMAVVVDAVRREGIDTRSDEEFIEEVVAELRGRGDMMTVVKTVMVRENDRWQVGNLLWEPPVRVTPAPSPTP